MGLIFGSSGKDESFKPQNEFKLEPWISIHIGGVDLSVNKAVLYLVLASGLTIGMMTWISRRMQQKPNRVQMAVELGYDLTRNQITGGNLTGAVAGPLVPLPRHPLLLHLVLEHDRLHPAAGQHRAHGRHLRRRRSPTFALYAATANISIPLMLTLSSGSPTTSKGSGRRASSPTWRAGCRPGSRT